MILLSDAVLITGSSHYGSSDTTELYVPSTGVSCTLPDIPQPNIGSGLFYHTLDSGLICGGYYTYDICLKWRTDTGTWEEYITLDIRRYDHVSWTPSPEIGTYLMGGHVHNNIDNDNGAGNTTTLIKPDGTQEPGFPLKYKTLKYHDGYV